MIEGRIRKRDMIKSFIFGRRGEVSPLSQQHVVTNQSTPAASETRNVATLRAALLDGQQQQNTTTMSKARSIALARNSANHAKLLAAADAITCDRVIVLETIVKIAQNAHKDAKYRSVKSSSKTLQEKVLRCGGGPLLAAVGFEDRGETWELSSEACAEHLQTLSSLLDAAQKFEAPATLDQGRPVAVEGDSFLDAAQKFEASAALDQGKPLVVEGDSSAATAGIEQISEVLAASMLPNIEHARLHTEACVLNSQQRYSEAVHHFEAAIALGDIDESAMFHVGFGVALLGADRPVDAITHLATAQSYLQLEAARHSAVPNHTASACALAMLLAAQIADDMGGAAWFEAMFEDALEHMQSITAAQHCMWQDSATFTLDVQEMEMYMRMKLVQAFESVGRFTDAEVQQEAACRLLSIDPTLQPDAFPKFVIRACLADVCLPGACP